MNYDNTECVGPGWESLIRVLDAEMDKHGGTVHQVKEKFGGLRYYYSLPEKVDKGAADLIGGLVQAAELFSYHMCEECGKPGTTAGSAGWIKVLCERHRRLDDERRLREQKPTNT